MGEIKQLQDNSYFENELSIIDQILSSQKRRYVPFKLSIIFSFVINFVLIVINIPFSEKIDQNTFLAFARVARVRSKLTKVLLNTTYIGDEIRKFDFSIFRIGLRKERFKFIVHNYFILCKKEYHILHSKIYYTNNDKIHKTQIARYFMVRIPHAMIYKFAIDQALNEYKRKIVFTGQMYDYFSQIEREACHAKGKRLICIPHGIESTQKLPLGYSGDIILSSSKKMADLLNGIYHTNKFLYRYKINEKIYKATNSSEERKDNPRKIVFFTQPLMVEETKKLIEKIAHYIERKGFVLYIKVHPLESCRDYTIQDTVFINDFSDAISNSLCISLVSTILIEAKYNNSTALSIVRILDTGNTSSFLYFDQDDIHIPGNEEDLFVIIDRYLGNI